METIQSAQVEPHSTGCCRRFDPTPLQGALIEWHNEPFVKEHVTSLLHVPLNMGSRMARANARIEAASAKPEVALTLSDEASPWGTDLLVHAAKPVPGAQMVALTGTFMIKVFEGPFRNAPKWAEEMREYVVAAGKELDKLYFGYTTCPSCAKAYGKNDVVLCARIKG